MGKTWDKLDGVGTGGATFSQDGMGKGFNALPSFTGTPNPLCLNCKGSKRGRDRKGFKVCKCDNPSFPNIGREQGIRMQMWHREWLEAAFHVLEPGGIIKVFGGTRVFHRLAAAMEEAGFRDVWLEAWGYGSGFPKSLNVGKSIDKQWGRLNTKAGDVDGPVVALKKELRELFDASGKTRGQIDHECGFRACNYLSYPEPGKRPDPWFTVLPSQEKWAIMKQVLLIGQDEVRDRLDEVFKEAEREVVGYKKAIPGVAFSSDGPHEVPITAPATDDAKQWDGWGTALKPAWEPVLVGVKSVGSVRPPHDRESS